MAGETSHHPNVTVEELAPDEYSRRTVSVDFLFLDREVCERCGDAETSIHAALDWTAELLDDLGVGVVLRYVHVESEAHARQTSFEISPTIRIDGRDVQPEYVSSPCEPCGERCGCGEGFDDDTFIECRSWLFRGEEYETPPVEFLVEELLRAGLESPRPGGGSRGDGHYRLPENLRRFFGTSAARPGDVAEDVGAVADVEPCC